MRWSVSRTPAPSSAGTAKNLRRGTSPSLRARAPAALEALPAPDAVFIGGTKGSMATVVDTVLAKNAMRALLAACAGTLISRLQPLRLMAFPLR